MAMNTTTDSAYAYLVLDKIEWAKPLLANQLREHIILLEKLCDQLDPAVPEPDDDRRFGNTIPDWL